MRIWKINNHEFCAIAQDLSLLLWFKFCKKSALMKTNNLLYFHLSFLADFCSISRTHNVYFMAGVAVGVGVASWIPVFLIVIYECGRLEAETQLKKAIAVLVNVLQNLLGLSLLYIELAIRNGHANQFEYFSALTQHE